MKELTQWVLLNKVIVGSIISALLSLVIYLSNRDTINLHLKAWYYRFPILGKNARLSKRLSMDDQNWFNSEREVCNSFLPFYDQYIADPYHYEQSSLYLNKVGDTGISPMKWYTWLALSIMVLIEAAGFAYVLAGFTIQDGSEAIQIQAAIGIALLISVLLVGFTHAMGGEIYKNQQIGKVRLRWQNDPNKPNIIEHDSRVGLKSKSNEEDDHSPSWRQIANRLAKTNANFTKSWGMSIVTLIFISIVAVGATYVRGQVLEKLAIEEISGHELGESNDPFQMGSTVFDDDTSAPAEFQQVNKDAENKAFRDAINAHNKGGWMTFIMLAVIFLAMQAYSIYLGFKSTFSGKESSNAYDATYRFSNVNTYLDYYAAKRASVERVAQSVLSHLQSKLAIYAQQNSGEQEAIKAAKHPSSRSFINYFKLRELIQNEVPKYVETSKVSEPIKETMLANEKEISLSKEIVEQVRNERYDSLTDEQIVEALRIINNEKQAETPAQRIDRLQKQALESQI
ncbi:hypothetical protein [Photobacterium leiognathi]|uniref:hypothetical protein n=1 Tax=Photobacterium leiognathi TaxID=553611 RepID=UPI0029821404|nr:hypothetical protein [Photobacterium leiognathi]